MSVLHEITFLVNTDPDFRKALLDDPRAALAQRGIEANREELSALGRVLDLVACSPEGLLKRITEWPDQPRPWQLQSPASQTESG